MNQHLNLCPTFYLEQKINITENIYCVNYFNTLPTYTRALIVTPTKEHQIKLLFNIFEIFAS